MKKDTKISKCKKYRYSLMRYWGEKDIEPEKMVNFVMLNPSKADSEIDDATIRKCIGFCKEWGYEGFYVTNLFAWRETDAKAVAKLLDKGIDVIGSENDMYINKYANISDITVIAWGNSCPKKGERVKKVMKILEDQNLFAIGEPTKQGNPRHPLMISYKVDLIQVHTLEATKQIFGTTNLLDN